MRPRSGRDVTRIVIGGGGVAGLEAALALGDLAGGRIGIDLVSPLGTFVDRPMTVLDPFGDTHAEEFPVSDILAGLDVHHHVDSVAWIDRAGRRVHMVSGASIAYDGLLLCPGARIEPAFPHAVTVAGAPRDPVLAGVIADLDAGAISRIAFVVPAARSWQLPLYELALLTAARARERALKVSLTIFTPGRLPMEAFGERAGRAARQLLLDAGIEVICRTACRVPDSHTVLADTADNRSWPELSHGHRDRPLTFDRIIALPRLRGPHIRGVPVVDDGFIPVDVHGRILGTQAVFAAGDATNFPVKHGSVAAQQADTAAATLAALAGADVSPAPFHPVARGVLLTGTESRRLSASIVGGYATRSAVAATDATGIDKLDARYLSPRLEALRDGRVAPMTRTQI